MKPLLVADLFCGAGGTSTGAEKAIKALGRKMVLTCVNHWPIAIETHKLNHPTARHYVEDITVADPEKLVPEGRLDLLMASPECRYYSRARGGRPVHDQGRMNPWAIHKWLTALDVRCVLIENVTEFIKWGPLLPDGTPDPKGKGQYFQAWLKTFWELGYHAEWRYLNAADYGDATTRIRFFLIARKDGRPIQWPTPSHSESGAADMIEHLARWRAAQEIIDWDNPGRSLIDDPKYVKKPLSEKTLRRIAKGLQKFGGKLAPLYIQLLGIESLGQNATECHSTAEPFVMGKNGNPVYKSAGEPLPTVTTKTGSMLVNPTIEPFVMGKQGHSPAYRAVSRPIPTLTTDGHPVLIETVAKPFIIGQHSGSESRDANEPIPTVVASAKIRLIEPTLIKYYGGDDVSDINKPLPTVTTNDRFGLVTPVAAPFIVQNRIRPDGDRVYPLEKPLNTVTGHGAGALVEPVLVEVNHQGSDRSSSANKPLKTVTTKRGTAVISPFMVQWDQTGSNGDCVRKVDQPLATIVTKKNTGLVEPIIRVVNDGKIDPRRLVLVDGEPYLLDLRFRMLTNLELARAMGFTDNETEYEFVGNSTEVTKQIGNAVPVHMAQALVQEILG